jgi:GNAT superfamily N-acetyltransferase
MSAETATARQYTWRPLTPDRWDDLEALYGSNGADGGCWCMWFRLTRSQFATQCQDGGPANREALREITMRGDVPGILAYEGGVPIGWCSVAPRDQFPALDRSPLFKRRDDTPVWSIVCFYVDRKQRSRGVMAYLVRAAMEYVREHGGGVIEAYPRCGEGHIEAASGYVGLLSVFTMAGYVEVARPSPTRSIVRYEVRP